jgi:hypothetical protein
VWGRVGRWVTLRARWVTLRARWVRFRRRRTLASRRRLLGVAGTARARLEVGEAGAGGRGGVTSSGCRLGAGGGEGGGSWGGWLTVTHWSRCALILLWATSSPHDGHRTGGCLVWFKNRPSVRACCRSDLVPCFLGLSISSASLRSAPNPSSSNDLSVDRGWDLQPGTLSCTILPMYQSITTPSAPSLALFPVARVCRSFDPPR